jgi:putative NIF3 family GTP cyclohydrolase 1 type 2
MNSRELYQKLDKEFELDRCRDDWSEMKFNEFISNNFKRRYMGILVDNSEEIESVFTSVFPSDHVLNTVLKRERQNILLFTHHPMIWDIRNAPNAFVDMNTKLLQGFKEKKDSIYTLHVPLDKNGKYSTAVNLAEALGIVEKEEFFEYFGVNVGIIGSTELNTVEQLAEKTASIVGHKVKLWKYGNDQIKDNKIALVAGGGNIDSVHQELHGLGVNTVITGVTALNNHSRKAHETAKEKGINIIGATHYSTEKFACIAMCNYFWNYLGLSSEFIEDKPVLADME